MERELLLIDEIFRPLLNSEQIEHLCNLIFVGLKNGPQNIDEVKKWLYSKLSKEENDKAEIDSTIKELVEAYNIQEEKRKSLDKAISDGRSVEAWLAAEIGNLVAGETVEDTIKYLEILNQTVEQARKENLEITRTLSGEINRNPNLDGFIAEKHHADTFNLNAVTKKSPYRAKVLGRNGKRYAKNSPDLAIYHKDKPDDYIKLYQSKYCKNARETVKALNRGDYNGQTALVPTEQMGEIKIPVTDVLSYAGITSDPLTKAEAGKQQEIVQRGDMLVVQLNNGQEIEVCENISKNIMCEFATSFAIGFYTEYKTHKDATKKELVIAGISNSSKDVIKIAIAYTIREAVKKGKLKFISEKAEMYLFMELASAIVDTVNVICDITKGEITIIEGLKRIENVAAYLIAGCFGAGFFGAALGPAGIGHGIKIGFMVGAKLGETLDIKFQQIRSRIIDIVIVETKVKWYELDIESPITREISIPT